MKKISTYIFIAFIGVAGLVINSCSGNETNSEKNGDTQRKNTNLQPLNNQTKDAFSGDPINISIYEDYKGKRVYFCCFNSKSEFKRNPQRYLDEFKRQGVSLKNTP